MGNAATGAVPAGGTMGQALCATPTCRIFGQQLAKRAAGEPECGTITVKLDASQIDHVVWPPSPSRIQDGETLVFLPQACSQEDLAAERRPSLLTRNPCDGIILKGGVPRSRTRGPEGGEQMREASEAAAAAVAAQADRRAREERLRRELDERRAEGELRRAEVEAERRRREEAARHRREEREENARVAKARRDREEQEAQERLACFLTCHGFAGPRDGKRKRFRISYPLHVAVKQNDPEMVQLLLQANADPSQRDSSGKTPQELARRYNRHGSHEKVLSMLAAL